MISGGSRAWPGIRFEQFPYDEFGWSLETQIVVSASLGTGRPSTVLTKTGSVHPKHRRSIESLRRLNRMRTAPLFLEARI
jgi:hypothetical protein